MENASAALPLFTAALERNTSRPELAHYGRAIANETLGNTRAAYDDYRRASELRPGLGGTAASSCGVSGSSSNPRRPPLRL